MKDYLSIVVPIRKGSVRVKNKNLRKFNSKNLLIYKILKLKKLKNIDQIIINTDSEEAIKIAKKLKVSYFRRQKYFASSKCSNSTFWQNIAETTNSKYLMFTNCTSPLIKINSFDSNFFNPTIQSSVQSNCSCDPQLVHSYEKSPIE